MELVSVLTGVLATSIAFCLFSQPDVQEDEVDVNMTGGLESPGRHIELSCQTCRKLKRHKEVELNLFVCTKCKRHIDLR
jgi:acetyl-CoA carboxylase beta subunit